MPRTKLTSKEERFVLAYRKNGRNGRAAYRTACPDNKLSSAALGEEVKRLMRRPLVLAEFAKDEAKATKALERSAKKYAINKESISDELAKIAFADDGKMFKLADKRQALMDLAKLHGLIVEKRQNMREITALEDLTDEELMKLMAEAQRRERDTASLH